MAARLTGYARRVRNVVGIAVLALVFSAIGAYAAHQFNDVPNDHAFHDEIGAFADAGITGGFPDGGFHPTDPVTRQAAAAFGQRGLPRVTTGEASGAFPIAVNDADGWTTLGSVQIETGGVSGGTQFVSLDGDVVLDTRTVESFCNGTSQPCSVQFRWSDTDQVCFDFCVNLTFYSDVYEVGYRSGSFTTGNPTPIHIGAVFPEPSNNTNVTRSTYHLQMQTVIPAPETNDDENYIDALHITASTSPFGWDGTDALSSAGDSGTRQAQGEEPAPRVRQGEGYDSE